MTHELKKIIHAYESAQEKGISSVLATVVALDGSSYRRPGVRMLILENSSMIGSVSGGCVEKEVLRQAESVFKNHQPKMMVYDGRYRLGCEGVLYILIEPFTPNKRVLAAFHHAIRTREYFKVVSYFSRRNDVKDGFGSMFYFENEIQAVTSESHINQELEIFEHEMKPCFKLMIIGAEHDAVQLTSYAALTGWEVTIIATLQEEKSILDFPGANELITAAPEQFPIGCIDEQTAVVVMTHSYVKDLKYLQRLKDTKPVYLGLLGPFKRREKLLNDLFEYCPEVSEDFFDSVHGPAGLNIGAETPQEIAISILSEILSVVREQEPIQLKYKEGGIHVQ